MPFTPDQLVEAKCDKCGNYTQCVSFPLTAEMVCPVCLGNNQPPIGENPTVPPQPAFEPDENPPEASQAETQKVYSLAIPDLASELQHQIAKLTTDIGRTILEHNQKHGDSALRPLQVHSQASTAERLYIMADEKLASYRETGTQHDLAKYIGYLLLNHIARGRELD